MSGGFFMAPEAIVAELGPAQAVLYGRIWRYCQGGGTCYASLDTLAKECGVSRPTVCRWIGDLVDTGYITRQSGQAAGRTSVLVTTRKWVAGGVSEVDQGGGSILDRGADQILTTKRRLEDKSKDRIASPRSAQPKTKGAPRAPRPLFDAFKASFPTAPDSVAGRFNKECDRLGYTVDQWRVFMTDRHTQGQVSGGFITRNNALDRFSQWCKDHVSRDPRAVAAPPDAPPDWRELVYTHDGTRRAPALILPRIGLDRFTPAAAWPAWLRELEGIAV